MQQYSLSMQSVELYLSRTDSIMNPVNTLMGCALAAGFAPEVAAASPLITGDR